MHRFEHKLAQILNTNLHRFEFTSNKFCVSTVCFIVHVETFLSGDRSKAGEEGEVSTVGAKGEQH